MVRMLYIGLDDGTSLDRANAYRRLGHEVTHLNTRRLLPHGQWIDHITWQLGDYWLSSLLYRRLAQWLAGKHFDYCHVDASEWLGPAAVRLLKQHCTKVVNYNIDDPTGPRDSKRFMCYRRAVPEYDLLCVVRHENIDEVKALGARQVLCVRRSADEVSHAPRKITETDRLTWAADVLFIGTWMPERGPFLLELIRLGVPLTIRGARWQKAPEWPALKNHWKGGHLTGDDYAKAIQCAKVNLGLVSEGNRDQHTTRSAEIPALGGLLCAKRTDDHAQMYQDNKEAVFWDTPEECAQICLNLVHNSHVAEAIRNAGAARCRDNGYLNQRVCGQLLEASEIKAITSPVRKSLALDS